MMRKRSMLALLVGSAACVVGVAGCSRAPIPDSVMRGEVDAEAFPSGATSVVATSTEGARVSAPIDAAKAFSLTLHPSTWSFAVVGSDGSETPMALAGANGTWAMSLPVLSAGATIDLGAVRFLAQHRSTAARVPSLNVTTPVCTAGTLSTGEPCIADSGAPVCRSHGCPNMGGERGDHGGHHNHHDHRDGDREHGDGDGEHADDVETAAPLEQSIVLGPIAVPTHGVTSAANCGDDDDHDEADSD